MTAITQCPECGTRFKVTDAQLEAHEGLVRCGHCHEVFDADKHLHNSEPSPQLSLPIEPELAAHEVDLSPIPNVPELEPEPTTLAQQVQFVEELTDEVLEMPPRKINWLGMLASLLLTLTLLAQFAYFYRIDIGTQLPGLKPLLEDYCELLQCTVTLPQNADLIVIESSELESDPDHANIVTLHVLVHNKASYPQAYPSLELTLTSIQDQSIARRVFLPADYLKAGEDEKQGFPAKRDLDIKLHLDTTDLKPAGYRLFLFYPQ
ncbi:DUF3426 domain-containing protein [Sideroxydans lithotrophicus]|uniref:MJ0042 family finger-like protein n=1 Tax=Sideroxydans lithotrophicus (strain ES-1) TaxID=580332 RepID=D5CPT8_SIDLE|nr:DUF3426 domain-containing protein [Sideroxydans lithotrophicus]ADE13083.1 MJ0042 family finger-like protein [Sideroxydans lithotrophicus ES-1]